MTRSKKATRRGRPARAKPLPRPGYWLLQDAKARFSELVREAREHGAQHVTVHGHEAVVVVSAEEYERLKPRRTGADLIAALQACPRPDLLAEVGAAGRALPVSKPVSF
jgi:prevent-host-death family protein